MDKETLRSLTLKLQEEIRDLEEEVTDKLDKGQLPFKQQTVLNEKRKQLELTLQLVG